ncbi:H-2 class I histocompatibility antigen, Q9 alpha chain-like [Macrotis lagotis]|uniref:H-2 class I histocompatibility antigen, Q9 alpha chain-like n=1 Tax=Macrotis lagotis TaxID=92651 RepID=UPI003D68EB95
MEPRRSAFLLLLLLLGVPTPSRAGSHSLRYFYTGWSGSELGGPGFVIVGYVDDREFVRFDGAGPGSTRAAWMGQMDREDPEYWERETRASKNAAQVFGAGLETLRGYYNQSRGGAHTLQRMYGCEVSDGRLLRGFEQYAYDGQDYISLDTDTWTWAAVPPQAEITKRKWEAGSVAERRKAYLEEECVLWLQKYLQMGRGALTRAGTPLPSPPLPSPVGAALRALLPQPHSGPPRTPGPQGLAHRMSPPTPPLRGLSGSLINNS